MKEFHKFELIEVRRISLHQFRALFALERNWNTDEDSALDDTPDSGAEGGAAHQAEGKYDHTHSTTGGSVSSTELYFHLCLIYNPNNRLILPHKDSEEIAVDRHSHAHAQPSANQLPTDANGVLRYSDKALATWENYCEKRRLWVDSETVTESVSTSCGGTPRRGSFVSASPYPMNTLVELEDYTVSRRFQIESSRRSSLLPRSQKVEGAICNIRSFPSSASFFSTLQTSPSKAMKAPIAPPSPMETKPVKDKETDSSIVQQKCGHRRHVSDDGITKSLMAE
eukprot:gene36542-biopygen9166